MKFLYTDDCSLTENNAVFVLYLAEKYNVPSLSEKCVEFLAANLAEENVFVVLQQALKFDKKKLENKCWDMIDLKTNVAVVSEAFTDISQSTLAQILERESLNIKDVDLFKAVMKWSEAECRRKKIEVNAKNKRAVIGDAMYQVRFLSMTSVEFGQNVSQSDMLTPEEMILFYDKFNGVERTSEVVEYVRKRGKRRTTTLQIQRLWA